MAKVRIDYVANTEKFNSELNEATRQSDKLEDSAKGVGDEFDRAADEAEKLGKEVDDSAKKGSKLGDTMKKVGGIIAAAFAVGQIVAFTKASTAAFNIQAKSEAKLAAALKGREDVQKRLIQQASRLQAQTLFGDEELINQQAFLANLEFTEDQINTIISASVDLAAANENLTLESSVLNLAKTFSGLSGELGELIPQLREVTQEELRAGKGVEIISELFKGQAAIVAGVGTGSWEQFLNVIGDATERFGGFVIRALNPMIAGLKNMVISILDTRSETEKLTDAWRDQTQVVNTLETELVPLIDEYETLTEKTDLSEDEQVKLNNIIRKIAEETPAAITEIDKFGNVIAISAEAAREFVVQQQAILAIKNADAIAEQREALEELIPAYDAAVERMERFNRTGTFVSLETRKIGDDFKVVKIEAAATTEQIEFMTTSLRDLSFEKTGLEGLLDELTGEGGEKSEEIAEVNEEVESMISLLTRLSDEINAQFEARADAITAVLDAQEEAELLQEIINDIGTEITLQSKEIPDDPFKVEEAADKASQVRDKEIEETRLFGDVITEIRQNIADREAEISEEQSQRRIDLALEAGEQLADAAVNIFEILNKADADFTEDTLTRREELNAALALLAIQSARQAVAIAAPIILANQVAQGGFIGIATAAVLIGIVTGALIAAENKIKANMFEGTEFLTGDRGRDQIPINANYGERIVDTRTNKQLKGIKNKELPEAVALFKMIRSTGGIDLSALMSLQALTTANKSIGSFDMERIVIKDNFTDKRIVKGLKNVSDRLDALSQQDAMMRTPISRFQSPRA